MSLNQLLLNQCKQITLVNDADNNIEDWRKFKPTAKKYKTPKLD